MKTKILLLLFSFLFGGKLFAQNEDDTIKEKARTITVLNYEMIEPEKLNSLFYKDSIMEIDFDILSDQIGFRLRNETSKPIKVVWDDATLGIFNVSHKVMHSGIKYIDRNGSMAASTVLPGTILDDMMIPTDRVHYRQATVIGSSVIGGDWYTSPIYIGKIRLPKDQKKIDALTGEKLIVYLPIMNNAGKLNGYTFIFQILGTIQIDSD